MPDCGKQRSLFHSPWKTLPRFPHFSPHDCGYAPLEKGILIVRNAKKYLTAITGVLFAVSSMLIFLIGIPRLRYFFPAAVVLGCGVALILRRIRRETPGKPWILSAAQGTDVAPAAHTGNATSQSEDLRRKLQLATV